MPLPCRGFDKNLQKRSPHCQQKEQNQIVRDCNSGRNKRHFPVKISCLSRIALLSHSLYRANIPGFSSVQEALRKLFPIDKELLRVYAFFAHCGMVPSGLTFYGFYKDFLWQSPSTSGISPGPLPRIRSRRFLQSTATVSYTHLTLPTNSLV